MGATPLSAALRHLRDGDTSISTFEEIPWLHQFGAATKVDSSDVRDGKADLHRDLDETALRRCVKVDFQKSYP